MRAFYIYRYTTQSQCLITELYTISMHIGSHYLTAVPQRSCFQNVVYSFNQSGIFSYLPRANLLKRGQVWESLANREGIIERWAVPRASHAISQQSGEEGRYSMTELASNLYSQESWGQGVCHSPRIGCCTFKAENNLRCYLRYCYKLLHNQVMLTCISILTHIIKHNIHGRMNPIQVHKGKKGFDNTQNKPVTLIFLTLFCLVLPQL